MTQLWQFPEVVMAQSKYTRAGFLARVFINTSMKSICLSLFLVFFMALSVSATRTEVSTAAEISGTTWSPGDSIVMLNGIWTDQTIKIRGEGTSEQPIVLMAETPGELILNGKSRLSIAGKHIVVTGLYFKDGVLSGEPVVQFRTSSSDLADSCRLTNTTIINYNPPVNTTDSKWVSIYGKDNKVDHCTFVNKTNSGTLLVVWLKSGITVNHIIEHNFFGFRNANLDSSGKELNGQEIIRIGDSKTSMTSAGVRVSNNYFEHCNGEIEIISNKSCDNHYSNNIFYECVGMLTLRHGNRCTVEGNYFFGNGISNSGGVRVIGEDHKIYNNYFDNLRGTGWRAALCLVRGQEDSELNEYFQVKNATVVFNTMVNCQQSFSVNYNSSSDRKMTPIGSTIAHNHVYNTVGRNSVTIYQTNVAELDVTWKNNLMNQGSFNGFVYDSSEVIIGIEPAMEPAGTTIEILEPSDTSALADYSTDEYAEVMADIRGRERDTVKTPGASQLSDTVSREMPTRENTGSDYFTPPTAIRPLTASKQQELMAYASNHSIFIDVPESGILAIYDISGRCLLQKKMALGTNIVSLNAKEILLLRFQSKSGRLLTKKIALN